MLKNELSASAIEAEAEALYEDYRRQKPHAVAPTPGLSGVLLPSWRENGKEDVRDAWRAAARGALERRALARGEVMVDPGGGPPDPG